MSPPEGFGGFPGRGLVYGGGGGFIVGRSINFTGTDSRSSINWLGTRSIDSPFTVAAWIFTPPGVGESFNAFNAGQFGTDGYVFGWGAGAGWQSLIRKSGTSLQLQERSTSTANLTPNSWYHAIASYAGDAATLSLYVGGTPIAQTNVTNTLTPGGTIFFQSFPGANAGWFMGNHQIAGNDFRGQLFNVGIYNSYFSAGDAALDYNGGNPFVDRLALPNAGSLLAWYPPLDSDANANTQISDNSGNSNHAAPGTNMAFSATVPP